MEKPLATGESIPGTPSEIPEEQVVLRGAPRWIDDALCGGVWRKADFYTPSIQEQRQIIAEYCVPCPVRTECLNFALENGERYGIWGGMTPKKRDALRKSLASKALR